MITAKDANAWVLQAEAATGSVHAERLLIALQENDMLRKQVNNIRADLRAAEERKNVAVRRERSARAALKAVEVILGRFRATSSA